MGTNVVDEPSKSSHAKKRLLNRSAEVAAVTVALGVHARATWCFFQAEMLVDLENWESWIATGLLSVVAAPIAWLLADLFSGLVHFLADNFGHSTTPVLGPLLIAPFREHHEFPEAILEHGFLERSAGNAVATLPLLVWIPWAQLSAPLPLLSAAVCLQLALWVVFTNEIHAHCHLRKKSGFIRWLQLHGVILAPEQHDRHHAAATSDHAAHLPAESALHYCVSSGICDRLAERAVRFTRKVRAPRRRAAR